MGRYKAYPVYKDSWVAWMGNVPEHWESVRFKQVLVEKKKTSNPELDAGSISFGNVIYKNSDNLPPETKASYQEVLAGEFLINPLNMNYDLLSLRTALSSIDVVVSTGYIVLQSKNRLLKKYTRWLLQEFDVAHMKTLGSGVRQTINYADIGNSFFFEPSEDEQEKIANFLDHETAKIDTLIEKQQQLIKLLKEKRQAVISHAVTKGLNPDVPMRDSGVEWLGEVPEGWAITPLKFISKIRYGIGEPPKYKNEGIPLVRATNIRSGRISEQNLVLVDPDDIPANRIVWLETGDIIVVRSGAGTGDSSIIPEEYDGSIAGFDMVVKPSKCIPAFLGYALLSNYIRNNQIDLEKTRAAQPHLNAEELGECFVLLPPDNDQMEIINYIDRVHSKLDSLVSRAEKADVLLRERRTALISAAVTGKIDVRSWTPPDQQPNKEDAA